MEKEKHGMTTWHHRAGEKHFSTRDLVQQMGSANCTCYIYILLINFQYWQEAVTYEIWGAKPPHTSTPTATRSVSPLTSGGHTDWLADSNYTVNFDMGTTIQGMWSSGTGINAYWVDATTICAKSIRILEVSENLAKLSLLVRRTASRLFFVFPLPSCLLSPLLYFF